MKGKIVLLGSLCVLLALVVIYLNREAPSTETISPNNEQPKEEVKFGTQEIHSLEISVNDVRSESVMENEDSQLVVVDITIKNQGDDVRNISLLNFTLVDGEGYAYSHSSNSELKGILGGQLHPERKNRGEMAFEVPVSSEYELVYTEHTRTGQLIWPLELD
ncbi:hypothetical protein AJ85_04495 [Alkalihalobacillus alcalophilus ATCC 27647 = CGMCC 1.3604]|uniref:DUF4352 domain-containing protein n=1 Tax=Alkalihalobacillus alcalophilus ATCC 27647 = CGMCC 1.3604 TaxID=1218173 RepID=A0A094WHL2_ALKAL|nr:DUF4352 domain-containing protein [Alkalihalobacillus alcalophilus]KGA97264.1 hypothetical protein BALCAV_0211200 [Alkalihalobacillus alcalophilus ATCC 27647 = CGMCC 1.3604]MED1562785.1 DUF4352 domain-containing protein [Alkalihalobacillus alcalophilus]THG91529.1 hypothetical protein AJ85_04495 [Alkalihalobacillus alcalophilus ATCC 27647 = CGMCC 1.3604]